MRGWHKEAEKQWDERAEWWHQSSEEMWERGSRKTIIPFVTTYMPKEGYIADIGCGDGYGSYNSHFAPSRQKSGGFFYLPVE